MCVAWHSSDCLAAAAGTGGRRRLAARCLSDQNETESDPDPSETIALHNTHQPHSDRRVSRLPTNEGSPIRHPCTVDLPVVAAEMSACSPLGCTQRGEFILVPQKLVTIGHRVGGGSSGGRASQPRRTMWDRTERSLPRNQPRCALTQVSRAQSAGAKSWREMGSRCLLDWANTNHRSARDGIVARQRAGRFLSLCDHPPSK